jgi:hypothetical protein
MNCLDLGFFASLQSLTLNTVSRNLDELIYNVSKEFQSQNRVNEPWACAMRSQLPHRRHGGWAMCSHFQHRQTGGRLQAWACANRSLLPCRRSLGWLWLETSCDWFGCCANSTPLWSCHPWRRDLDGDDWCPWRGRAPAPNLASIRVGGGGALLDLSVEGENRLEESKSRSGNRWVEMERWLERNSRGLLEASGSLSPFSRSRWRYFEGPQTGTTCFTGQMPRARTTCFTGRREYVIYTRSYTDTAP